MKDKRESKRREIILPDFQTRIREYNREKQIALLKAKNQEEVEKIIERLRQKWEV